MVYTADVPGAYLNTDMDEHILMCLTGSIVDILCTINPNFKKSVVKQKGKRVIYIQLLKALYGCVCSALLWYKL